MTRTVVFSDDEQGQQRFRFLWDGLRAGAMSAKPEERTPDVMRQESQLRKLLKSVSTNGEVAGGDVDARALQSGGGSVSLEQPLVKLLSQRGWSVQWTPFMLESAIDALDWLDASPTEDEQ